MSIHKKINPDGLFKTKGFTQAVSSTGNKTVYVSGQLPWDKDRNVVGKDDVKEQTRQVFRNIKCVLDEVGATWDDVVKLNAYVVGPEHVNTVARIKGEIIGDAPPADTIVGVSGLAYPDCLIEIDAIVMMDQ